jgi:hypothetical protein
LWAPAGERKAQDYTWLTAAGKCLFFARFQAFVACGNVGFTGLRVDLSFFGDNRFIAGITLH